MAQEKALASSESTSLSCAKRFSATSTALAAMSGRFILMQATGIVKDRKQRRRAHALFAREAFCEEDDHKRSALPIRMPPGTMADTSPGTVFLLAAICTDSKTFSTREPSIPCKKKSQCSCMLRNEIDIHFSLKCHRL
nr:hypothetical protein Iba_chr02cCG14690 [Ipomoea batatas]